MKKLYLLNLLYLTTVCISTLSCKHSKESRLITDQTSVKGSVITGFNQNWIDLPQLNNAVFIQNINTLAPRMIRYPGGTVTHKWNWRTGKTTTNHKQDELHLIGDIKKLVDYTGVKMIFVLDIVNRTVHDQITMLDSIHSLGVPIEFIELGNEIYLKDTPPGDENRRFEAKFPDGKAYADTVNKWVPYIRQTYPNAKIGAVLISKTAAILRQQQWNRKTVETITDIDAFIYHIYIPEGGSANQRIADFELAKVARTDKETWITEYGNFNLYTDSPAYLTELSKLADYIENNSNIALSHTLISKPKDHSEQHSKLSSSSNGETFTAEGRLFLERAASRKIRKNKN